MKPPLCSTLLSTMGKCCGGEGKGLLRQRPAVCAEIFISSVSFVFRAKLPKPITTCLLCPVIFPEFRPALSLPLPFHSASPPVFPAFSPHADPDRAGFSHLRPSTRSLSIASTQQWSPVGIIFYRISSATRRYK